MSMRFLPWARRGLAGVLNAVDEGGALTSRASFPVTVTVNGADATMGVTAFGPGDVTGLDPDAIVRTVPRQHATNVAPDEFVAPYWSFLLERTPKKQPDEPRTWRKDEYPD